MWRLGFFFHDMAFGLLTVFIPLYVIVFKNTSLLGGPLLALGVMTSIAIFCSIPASFLWGYLCDKTRHYKIFILLSFSSIAVILFLMTLPFAQNLIVFVILYVVMQILHVSHESPKNVLVTEHYSRKDWERSWGFYEGLTEIGFIIGLIIGLFMFASTTVLVTESMLVIYTFYLCSALSVVAFILAWALIADPLIIFERRLVGIERKLDKASRGFEGLSKLMDGLHWNGSLKEDSFLKFAFAIVLFALATSLFFTPLPIILNQRLNLPTSMVYVAYILNSLGATVGYFLIRARAQLINIKKQMPLFVLLRSVLIFALVGVIWFAFSPTITTAIVLVMLIFIGFAYAMYYIMMLSQSMEIIPQGKAGFFDGMVGLGAAIGAFLGPFLTYELNYLPVFVITAVIFLVAFIILKISR
jgi:MFS family permease